ncbi:Timeless protein [Cinara cedri]|uniref:Timeless protein n=1 Tax=Cinara cedri TaxID=506608 RepID=A0A5E4NIN3_9HEMI|nr:Timeless protein [Cinara cedri]
MIAVKDDNILKTIIKILVNIMTPIERLVQIDQFCKDENGYSTVLKHNRMLATNKIAFNNVNAIKRVIHVIKENILKLSSYQGLSGNSNTIIICDCLYLIKYILQSPNDQHQNDLLWILFSEKFGKIIIKIIENPNRRHWAVLITELIALIFKNQHVDHMTKLLNETNKFMKNSSSEDNESNTSPCPKSRTNSSQDEFESDENDIECHYECTLNQIPITFKEKLYDINSLENKDDNSLIGLQQNVHSKPFNDTLKIKTAFKEPTVIYNLKRNNKQNNKVLKKYSKKQKKELTTQQKLFMKNKKITSNSTDNKNQAFQIMKNIKLNFKIIPKHTPSQECISYFLQKFTVDFLQNGFNTLVDEIYNLVTTTTHQCIDSSLYFWILTYFCRFCKLNKINLKSVRGIVSLKLISYIVQEGFKVSEQLMIAKHNKSPAINLLVRHLHLVIMAIKEVIKTIEFYRLTAEGFPFFVEIIKDIKNSGNNSTESINTWAKDLKSIFVLLIHQYDSNIQVIDYLQDLIVANHMIISLFDNFKNCWNFSDSITAHIKKFAAYDIMFNYGTVLQNYKKNDAVVNEAVFTMMHHIIGEVENTTVLFQPTIMKTFLKIYEEENEVYQRWSDLIECMIHMFLQMPKFNKFGCRNQFDGTLELPSSPLK